MMTHPDDPYHEGERRVQEMIGEREQALARCKTMTERIPSRAMDFVAEQQYVLLGWSTPEGTPWACFLTGLPGFAVTDNNGEYLTLILQDNSNVLRSVPPFSGLTNGDYLGVLFTDLSTRRRLRVNGPVTEVQSSRLTVAVDRAYPLCPKYIQRRRVLSRRETMDVSDTQSGETLTGSLIDWIESSDTCFVASAHPDGPADVSHRGGNAGFIRVSKNTLTVPDYPGNSMFNTLGNLALNPRAGLVFLDFQQNRQLQMTGSVSLDLNNRNEADRTGGTGRWWYFHVEHWFVSPLNQAFDWAFMDESPFNP